MESNVNEGEWHTIQMAVAESRTQLSTKEPTNSIATGVGCRALNIASPHYVGGADIIALETAKNHLEVTSRTKTYFF